MSAGEDRLASALEQALKAPWKIYRNVAWLEKRPGDEPQDGEADLVLAHPDLGVMVIEVKGGGIRRINGRWESVDRHGDANPIKDPFAQVSRAMHRLRRVCHQLPAWPAHDVRFTRAVCFPDAAELPGRAWERRAAPAVRPTGRTLSGMDVRHASCFLLGEA